MQGSRGFELETGEFQHINIGLGPVQRIQHRQPDVAGNHRFQPRRPAHRADQGGHRGLAVGAGDGDDPGAGGLVLRKQFDVPDHRHAAGNGSLHFRLGQRHTGAGDDEFRGGKNLAAERTEMHGNFRHFTSHGIRTRRRIPGIGDGQAGALALQPAQCRKAGITQPQHQHLFVVQFQFHLSFSVDNPSNTSIMVMIQNRTTTCVSFQPFCS
jgi:hypothetical protein